MKEIGKIVYTQLYSNTGSLEKINTLDKTFQKAGLEKKIEITVWKEKQPQIQDRL